MIEKQLFVFKDFKFLQMIIANARTDSFKRIYCLYRKNGNKRREVYQEVIIDTRFFLNAQIFMKVKKANSIKTIFTKTFNKITPLALLNCRKDSYGIITHLQPSLVSAIRETYKMFGKCSTEIKSSGY